jgi:hypothetical protein
MYFPGIARQGRCEGVSRPEIGDWDGGRWGAVLGKQQEIVMSMFSDNAFHNFLGEPLEAQHNWGREWRFSISRETLGKYSDTLRDTLYAHHSFFNLHEEIAELGFVLSAQAMKDRYSGNPKDHNTQMGNLGEVLGAHFAREYLNFRGELLYPKRYNTNPEQSQKGIDILGFKDILSPAELLIGEVKARRDFEQGAVREDYEALCRHQNNGNLIKKTHFARACFRDNKENLKNIDRHESATTPKHFLLLSITEDKPSGPFAKLPEFRQRYGTLSNLLAVHIEIRGLIEHLPALYA